MHLVTGSGQVNLGIVKLLVKRISGSLGMRQVRDGGRPTLTIRGWLGFSCLWPLKWRLHLHCQTEGKQKEEEEPLPVIDLLVGLRIPKLCGSLELKAKDSKK